MIIHLLGNLTLFTIDYTDADNGHLTRYAAIFLHDLGWLLLCSRGGLLTIFLIHAYLGVAIYLRRKTRGTELRGGLKSRGGAGKVGFAHVPMVDFKNRATHLLLDFTLSLHVNHFKFGSRRRVGWAEYTQQMNVGRGNHRVTGFVETGFLKRLVNSTKEPSFYVIGYVGL